MVLFKFGGLKIICQTAKLNTLPIILRIRYKAKIMDILSMWNYHQLEYNFMFKALNWHWMVSRKLACAEKR